MCTIEEVSQFNQTLQEHGLQNTLNEIKIIFSSLEKSNSLNNVLMNDLEKIKIKRSTSESNALAATKNSALLEKNKNEVLEDIKRQLKVLNETKSNMNERNIIMTAHQTELAKLKNELLSGNGWNEVQLNEKHSLNSTKHELCQNIEILHSEYLVKKKVCHELAKDFDQVKVEFTTNDETSTTATFKREQINIEIFNSSLEKESLKSELTALKDSLKESVKDHENSTKILEVNKKILRKTNNERDALKSLITAQINTFETVFRDITTLSTANEANEIELKEILRKQKSEVETYELAQKKIIQINKNITKRQALNNFGFKKMLSVKLVLDQLTLHNEFFLKEKDLKADTLKSKMLEKLAVEDLCRKVEVDMAGMKNKMLTTKTKVIQARTALSFQAGVLASLERTENITLQKARLNRSSLEKNEKLKTFLETENKDQSGVTKALEDQGECLTKRYNSHCFEKDEIELKLRAQQAIHESMKRSRNASSKSCVEKANAVKQHESNNKRLSNIFVHLKDSIQRVNELILKHHFQCQRFQKEQRILGNHSNEISMENKQLQSTSQSCQKENVILNGSLLALQQDLRRKLVELKVVVREKQILNQKYCDYLNDINLLMNLMKVKNTVRDQQKRFFKVKQLNISMLRTKINKMERNLTKKKTSEQKLKSFKTRFTQLESKHIKNLLLSRSMRNELHNTVNFLDLNALANLNPETKAALCNIKRQRKHINDSIFKCQLAKSALYKVKEALAQMNNLTALAPQESFQREIKFYREEVNNKQKSLQSIKEDLKALKLENQKERDDIRIISEQYKKLEGKTLKEMKIQFNYVLTNLMKEHVTAKIKSELNAKKKLMESQPVCDQSVSSAFDLENISPISSISH